MDDHVGSLQVTEDVIPCMDLLEDEADLSCNMLKHGGGNLLIGCEEIMHADARGECKMEVEPLNVLRSSKAGVRGSIQNVDARDCGELGEGLFLSLCGDELGSITEDLLFMEALEDVLLSLLLDEQHLAVVSGAYCLRSAHSIPSALSSRYPFIIFSSLINQLPHIRHASSAPRLAGRSEHVYEDARFASACGLMYLTIFRVSFPAAA